ncbi:MAG: fibronectin type 3 domain-containing protein, partial [Arenicella sp.]
GEKVTEIFINATVPVLDVFRLLDDPLRSKTYAIQRNGTKNGSIISFDPIQESLISCITVGEGPTDFVINDDSTELLVINSVGKSIDVIDLQTFSLKETINLPSYSAWGDADDTTANIDLGPDDIIYYTDGTWGPVLHVFKRSAGEVLQSITFDGSSPSNDTGFMDFAVTSDKTRMVAMPQLGWSAGSHSRKIGQYTINPDGTVNFIKETILSNFSREPFEAPVLMGDDDQLVVMKTISTDPTDTDALDRSFPSAIWSMNPGGSVVATGDRLYEYETGKELYTIPGGSIDGAGYIYTKAQAFTSDFTRFVYFNASNRTLNVVNLIDEIGLELLGRSLNPEDGAVVNSPGTLAWAPLAGVDQYDIYLGTDASAIASADPTSAFYLGRIMGTSLALAQILINGTDYFWRIDPISAIGPETGIVYTFTVSDIGLDLTEVKAQTIAGHSDYQVNINLDSAASGVDWMASSEAPWVTFAEHSGSTPSTLRVRLDTATLAPGFHNSSIILTSATGELQIPVQLEIDPLNVTHIRSDRNSGNVYAISEDSSSDIPRAYLLEVDSISEKIQRVTRVGSAVTDVALHYADNLIYVTNWKSGNLLAIDKNTFELRKSIAFQPAGATGYGEGDVYRVAAGVSQRLVIEEQDQWVDISIFNTNTDSVVDDTFVREGGGAFDPTGRYYYHGENNSSGASIIKFDTSGDTFTQLAEIRPSEISSYYGSRTVVVSEDGSRVFWAGVALNSSLETEWGINDIVYSTTDDGRYAFSNAAIYDVNLRRQVLAMPTNTNVSGYNSNSKKLVTQVGDGFRFDQLTTPVSLSTPIIAARKPTSDSVELIWTDDSLEMQFFLQQRLAGTSNWADIHISVANVTKWTALNLNGSSAYEFRVRASAANYSSAWSNIVTITPDSSSPTVPLLFQPTEISTGVSLSWSNASNETGYELQRSLNGTDGWALIALGETEATAYIDLNVDENTTYYYRVKALGISAESSYSSIVNITTSKLIPTIPLLFQPTETSTGISVSWSNAANETGYSLERSSTGSDNWAVVALPNVNVIAYTDINVEENTAYYYRIKAIRMSSESSYSNVVTITTAKLIPTIPLLFQPTEISAGVSLSWSNSSNETGYALERSPNGSDSWAVIALPEVDATVYTDFNVDEGATYYYRIKALRTLTESGYSEIVTITTAIVMVTIPTLFEPREISTGVLLRWSNASNETGYVVERSANGRGSWAVIALPEANVTRYTDINVRAATTYYYRIKAVSESNESSYSATRDVTTGLEPPKPPLINVTAPIFLLLLDE